MVLEILSARITNTDNDTNEQAAFAIYRASAAGTGGATGLTEKPTEVGSAVASATAEHTYVTTDPTLESDPIITESAPLLTGFVYVPIPEERVHVSPSGILVLRLDSAITSSTINAEITWREIGG